MLRNGVPMSKYSLFGRSRRLYSYPAADCKKPKT